MSHGNTNRSSEKLDDFIERLNKKIAKLLGKKDKLPPQQKTNNLTFILIICLFCLLLWGMTGFYYLGEKQYGVVLVNGQVTKVVTGPQVGFTVPYPFGGIEFMDAGMSEVLNLGQDNAQDSPYITLSKNMLPIAIVANFTYQIDNPKMLYISHLQDQDNLDNVMLWNIQAIIHNYIAQKTLNELLKANLTIMANQLKEQANQILANYGIKVVKLNINNISSQKVQVNPADGAMNNLTNLPSAQSSLDRQLLQQAYVYEQNKLAQAKVEINQFNQLLPQYKANPQAIVEQMYYDLLATVPIVNPNEYPLLNLRLSDLIKLESSNQVNTLNDNQANIRNVDREVKRERNLEDRF